MSARLLRGLAGAKRLENIESKCYYGEYPYSFAACRGSTDIMQAIFERAQKIGMLPGVLDLGMQQQQGQDERWTVYAQDGIGNTALHMAIFYERLGCMDMILDQHCPRGENEAPFGLSRSANDLLHMQNLKGFTPLTYAVRLGNMAAYKHLLQRMTPVLWVFGSVKLDQVPLDQIDTWRRNKPEKRGDSGDGHSPGVTLHLDVRFRPTMQVIVVHWAHKHLFWAKDRFPAPEIMS